MSAGFVSESALSETSLPPWPNEMADEFDFRVSCLARDLRDGVRLARLVDLMHKVRGLLPFPILIRLFISYCFVSSILHFTIISLPPPPAPFPPHIRTLLFLLHSAARGQPGPGVQPAARAPRVPPAEGAQRQDSARAAGAWGGPGPGTQGRHARRHCGRTPREDHRAHVGGTPNPSVIEPLK